jgi:hypothetical protein
LELTVDAIVVYESMYGNTHAVAQAVAEGLGGATLLAAHDAAGQLADTDLLVVGGPTHMHGLASSRSRKAAAAAAQKDGATPLEPGAGDDPGLRQWLHDLPDGMHVRAAAFDTRIDKPAALTGSAAHGIARRLRHHGYEVIDTQSFLVTEAEGPLEDGELDRARAWGTSLAGTLATAPDHARTES